MRRKKRAGQRGRSKIAIRRPRNLAFLTDGERGWPHIRAESPNQPDGERWSARSAAVHRVFLRVGRSDDLRRAGREIYIDTRVKTIVSPQTATRTTILIRCDSRGIGSCRRASETSSFINRDRVCSALKENFSCPVEYRSRSWEYYCHAARKVRGNIHIRNECSLRKASTLEKWKIRDYRMIRERRFNCWRTDNGN